MAKCPNCNTKLSCGCQRRVASDGAQVCSNCISNYEKRIKKNIVTPITPTPGSTDPSNVKVVVTKGHITS